MRDIGPDLRARRRAAGRARRASTGSSTAGARRSGRAGTRIGEIARFVAAAAGAELVSSMLVNEGGASTSTARAPSSSPRPCSSTRAATPTQTRPASRPSSPAPSAPRRSSGCRAASPATTRTSARAATSTWSRRSPRRARCSCTSSRTPSTPTTSSCASCARSCPSRRMPRAARCEIIDLPAPEALRDDEGFVDWSYVNHLVVNGGVIACGYGEERADAAAREILAAAYPGRRVVTSTRDRSSPAAAASTASRSSSRRWRDERVRRSVALPEATRTRPGGSVGRASRQVSIAAPSRDAPLESRARSRLAPVEDCVTTRVPTSPASRRTTAPVPRPR